MALTSKQFRPIQQRNAWSAQQKAALKKVLGQFSGVIQQAAPAALTDATGGTVTNNLALITGTAPADLAAVGAQLTIIKNSISSLAAKVNANRAALIAAGAFV